MRGEIMAEHPNVARIQDGYAAFAKGDFDVLTDLFADNIVWHNGGRNRLTGDYRGREAVFGFFARLMEVTDGTFRIDLHAVLADDEHGVALAIVTASRDGQEREVQRGGRHAHARRPGHRILDHVGALRPDPAVEVVTPFEDTHYGTREMTVRDPDGRLWTLQAPSTDRKEDHG
jgi:ketosteroid isomerase-like protein